MVDALAADHRVAEVVGMARRLPERRPAKTRWVAADVASDDLATHFRGADAVVHLAWLFQPTHTPLVTWRGNVEGSIRVFEAAAAAGGRHAGLRVVGGCLFARVRRPPRR